ncbi:NADPH-dependent FMN reductase [Rhodoplanes sp. Z2-YC6860]|uniref:NADPH-dependent FMN reductase n=1 Tax=Rhodoplanes sp. Z2-YC6860 TaxID=674703 RepID=UPI00078E4F39|nr:NADPH-dependent FMN reductase [Rhodoplanes sp. Z2-YC6860]AMN40870.1 chromate reductase, Class I, flavoprotein [Rhodoplanes sp. Z2-YC6860]
MANVVAICGSLRKGSFNRMLMNASIGLAPAGMTIKEGPSFANIPIYNFDDQQSTGFPKDADVLHEAIRAADAVLVVSPEYNWSVPAGLKNAIDWLSRYKEVSFKDKPVAIQSAAGGLLGGARMQYALRMVLQAVDAQLFGKPEVIVNMAANKFADGKLTDQGAQDLIKQQLTAFAKFIERHKV